MSKSKSSFILSITAFFFVSIAFIIWGVLNHLSVVNLTLGAIVYAIIAAIAVFLISYSTQYYFLENKSFFLIFRESSNKKQIVSGFIVGLVISILYLVVVGILMAGGPPDSVKIGFAVISLIVPIALSLIYFKSRSILWRVALYTSLVLSVLYIVGTVVF